MGYAKVFMGMLALLAAGVALALPSAAQALCLATLQENVVEVKESAPHVELLVEPEGGVTCTGTIKWETRDRTARAPADYVGSKGELRWTATDQNGPQAIRVPIKNDTGYEQRETFSVTIIDADTNDGIKPEEAGGPNDAGGPTAIITILDDDKAPQSPPGQGGPTTAPPRGGTGPTPTTSASASAAAPTSTPTASPSSTSLDGTPLAAPGGGKKAGGSGATVAALLVGVLALAGIGGLMLRRRGA